MNRFNTASGRHYCNVNSIYPHNSQVLWLSFNTASGKCCYFITFVFPSLRSGTRDVRTSSSLRSSAASHPSSHTASDKYCCNPQKVWIVGNPVGGFNTASDKYCCNSGDNLLYLLSSSKYSFNTASDKYCCNLYHLEI